MLESRNKGLDRFLELCLRIADSCNKKSESEEVDDFNKLSIDEWGYGIDAISTVLRDGVCAVIQLQESYHRKIKNLKYETNEKEDAYSFVEEMFGTDIDVDSLVSINEEDRAKIKAVCHEIAERWDAEDDD